MKSLASVFLLSASLLFLGLTQLVQAQNSVPVHDFRVSPFSYGYEGWKDLSSVQTQSPQGVALKGSAKGGAGVIFDAPLNIASSKQVEIRIKKGPTNSESSLLFKLISVDGKRSTSWDIPLDGVSATDFTTITLDLARAQLKDGVDLENIKNLQIQGKFTPDGQVDVEIESITATGQADAPPPADATPPAPVK